MADPILQPFQLKHLTLRNRVMITSHEPAYSEDGLPTDAYRAYHVERARAGIALTMTAGSAVVSRDSPPAFGNLLAYRDEIIPHMARLAREVHDEGAAVMIQLTHLGRRTRWDTGDWLPVLSPSALREPAHRAYPKVLEDWDIARIISDYADAAERMKDAGLDGIELESYGHLMDAFWSPRLNYLDGRYGAETLETRMAFSMDVLRTIRARVGDDFIVGVRFVADEDIKGGISAIEGQEIARHLRDSGMVDFLNVIRGNIDTDASLTRVIPLQGMASAPHLNFAGELRAQTGIPIFHAARIPDLSTARHAIAAGKLDMVGMTRAHIADPHIMAKLLEGREEDIRPCVGANYCIDRIYQGEKALCLHNPSTGRELSQPHKIAQTDTPARVTIIGAGPAGLWAAYQLAQTGLDVILADEDFRMGGRLNSEADQIGGKPAADWAAEIVAKLDQMDNVRLMTRTTVTGAYDGGTYGAVERVSHHMSDRGGDCPLETFWRIHAKRAVLAAGALERTIGYANNDRPGIMQAGAVRSYLHRYGVATGKRVVVFGNNDNAFRTAHDLSAAGVEVAAYVDARADAAIEGNFPIYRGAHVTDTKGRLGLSSVQITDGGRNHSIAADCLAVSGGWNPTVHMTCHMNGRPTWNETIASFVPTAGSIPGMSVVGSAAGHM
ncbi:MAG: FAD-binding protein, partial [Rhodobacteraceae bacterium]|nr:FAD-binding protein [Paracoccaceae bacterium]